MTDRREAIRGLTPEGLTREAEAFIRDRPDVAWPVAFKAWLEVAGLDVERARQIKVELIRRRCFGRGGA